MTRPMSEQRRLDAAISLVLEAIDALHSAALADGDEGLELVDAVSIVGNGYSYLLAAGAMPAVARDVPPSLSAQEAARRAPARDEHDPSRGGTQQIT